MALLSTPIVSSPQARCRRDAGALCPGLCSRALLSRSDTPCCPASVCLPPPGASLPPRPSWCPRGFCPGAYRHRAAGKRFSHGACAAAGVSRLGHPSGIIITWLGGSSSYVAPLNKSEPRPRENTDLKMNQTRPLLLTVSASLTSFDFLRNKGSWPQFNRELEGSPRSCPVRRKPQAALSRKPLLQRFIRESIPPL